MLGAGIGSVIPGVGTTVGGVIGATVGGGGGGGGGGFNPYNPAQEPPTIEGPTLKEIVVKPKPKKPSFAESLIPVWGSYREAEYAFDKGDNWWGAFHSFMALTDIWLVKALGTSALKGIGKLGIRAGAREGAKTGISTVQFGKTANQINHAFRHTDALGLSRPLVQSTIQNHFKTLSSQVVTGKPFNQVIEIGGQKIQYTVFKLSDGTFNIGRIHGIK